MTFNSINERTIKEQRAHLSYFVVKPEYRNKGMGTQILQQIIRKLQNRKLCEVTIQNTIYGLDISSLASFIYVASTVLFIIPITLN